MAGVEGLGKLLGNISKATGFIDRRVGVAAREVADMLESYARTHTGDTYRPGRWITRPGLGVRKRGRVKNASAPGGYLYEAGSNRVWRPAGRGWGDVTGHLRKTIRGRVRRGGAHRIDVVLSANTPYAPTLELGHGGKWKWMRNAVMSNRRRIVQMLNRRMRFG